MDLNYFAFLSISFVPLLIASYWFHPKSLISRWSGERFTTLTTLGPLRLGILFVLSFTLVYGYINLIIHQMGFYELFFTDIMMGSQEAEKIVQDFLGVYGDKYRYFKHGVFHGLINAFVFALPFIGIHGLLNNKPLKYMIHLFSYWVLTSLIIGGLIAEFV
ncbi:MAG: hypothetical protein AAF985_03370 [Bacteroidota bacterium]